MPSEESREIMKLDKLKVYCVFDTEDQDYWVTDKGKMYWNAIGHAKNAWNDKRGGWKTPTFNNQPRFVVHEFLLETTRVKELK